MMEKMKRTFEYQRFAPNKRLSAMIEDVERRYSQVNDDDLFFVAAAGEADIANDFAEWDEDIFNGKT